MFLVTLVLASAVAQGAETIPAAPGELVVRAMDATGENAQKKATVEVFDKNMQSIGRTETDEKGFARFPGLSYEKHGDVWVRATKGGLSTNRKQIAWSLPVTQLYLGAPTETTYTQPIKTTICDCIG